MGKVVGNFVVDGGFVRIVVGFALPAYSACAVASVEVAWEGVVTCVVLGLNHEVDYRPNIFFAVECEGLLLL